MHAHANPRSTSPTHAEQAPVGSQRLERKRSVLARTGMSNTTLWRRAGRDFPAPIRLGPNTVAWVSAEVDTWIADRIADSRAQAVTK